MAEAKAISLSDLLNKKEREKSDSTTLFVGLKMERTQAVELAELLGVSTDSGAELFREMLRCCVAAKS